MSASMWTLYRFKLHMFLGPVRRQPAIAVLFGLLALLTLPGAYFFGYFLPETGLVAAGELLEVGSLVLSMLVAFQFVSTPGRGLLLQPAEVDFVAVAPVTLRRFVLADLVFQVTLFGVGIPVVGIAAAGYAIRLAAAPWAFLVPVAAVLALQVILTQIAQALGVARLLRKRWALPIVAGIVVTLVAPAILRTALRVPITYGSLPFPTTAAVEVALLPFGGGDGIGILLLALYAMLAVAAHAWVVNRPFLPNLRGTFALSFGAESKRLQQEALMRAFGRLRRGAGSRLYRTRVVNTMAALHLARMSRDGTLVLVAVVAAALAFPFLGLGDSAPTIGGLFVSTILPITAVVQWLATDRANLWIVLVAGQPPERFFMGWWLSLALYLAAIAGVIAALGGLVLGRFDASYVLESVAAAIGGTAGSIVAAARFPYAPNELSFRPILHFLLTGAGAGLGALAVLGPAFVLAGVPGVALLAGAAGSLAIGAFAFLVVGRATRRPRV